MIVTEQQIVLEKQIQDALAFAAAGKPKQMILGYVDQNGQLAISKFTGSFDAEALIFVAIQAAVLAQAQKNLFGSKAHLDASPNPNPLAAN